MKRRDFLRATPSVALAAAVPAVAVAVPRHQTPSEVVKECIETIIRMMNETAPEGFNVQRQFCAFADGRVICLATQPGYQRGDAMYSWDQSGGWLPGRA